MSYILDALKRAERERDIAQVPGLSTIHDIRTRPQVRMWVVSGMFVLCIMAALWFFLFRSKPGSSEMGPRSVEAPGQVASQPESDENVNLAPLGGSPPSPLPAESFKSPQPAVIGQNRINTMSVSPDLIQAPRAKTAAERSNGAGQESSTLSDSSASASEVAAVYEVRENPPDEPARKPAELVQTKQGGVQDRTEDAGLNADATKQKSVSLREAVSKMTMSVLFYSENKPERLVFIDGRKYVEGDMIEDKYLLESITPEGAVLSSQDERAVLRPGPR